VKGGMVMTGRQLIVYILENKLEDTEVFANGRLIGYLPVNEIALKFDSGSETVKVFAKQFNFTPIVINGVVYYPANIVNLYEYLDKMR
jgi:hypothetical protein